jgi:hypothetical protein
MQWLRTRELPPDGALPAKPKRKAAVAAGSGAKGAGRRKAAAAAAAPEEGKELGQQPAGMQNTLQQLPPALHAGTAPPGLTGGPPPSAAATQDVQQMLRRVLDGLRDVRESNLSQRCGGIAHQQQPCSAAGSGRQDSAGPLDEGGEEEERRHGKRRRAVPAHFPDALAMMTEVAETSLGQPWDRLVSPEQRAALPALRQLCSGRQDSAGPLDEGGEVMGTHGHTANVVSRKIP